MNWTGATWMLTEAPYVGEYVTITGSREDETFGKVWDGRLTCGEAIMLTDDTMARRMDPKTRKPRVRGFCA